MIPYTRFKFKFVILAQVSQTQPTFTHAGRFTGAALQPLEIRLLLCSVLFPWDLDQFELKNTYS